MLKLLLLKFDVDMRSKVNECKQRIMRYLMANDNGYFFNLILFWPIATGN